MAESLDIFRETVEAQLRSQDQRLVSLVSAMQRVMERINELKGQLLEPLFRKLISMALSSTSVHFARVIAMIDEKVTLPKAEQGDDDGKKTYYIKGFDQTEDKDKVSTRQIKGHKDTIDDCNDQLSNTDGRIEAVEKSLSELNESVAHAVLQEGIHEHIVEEIIDVPVPEMMEETIEVVQHNPQKQVQCVDKIVDVPDVTQGQVFSSQTVQKAVEVPTGSSP